MVTFVVSSLAFFAFFVSFCFTLMLYAISSAKTSVTYHKAVNRVNFLESSFSQVLSTD